MPERQFGKKYSILVLADLIKNSGIVKKKKKKAACAALNRDGC